jgi:hypothetical protein
MRELRDVSDFQFRRAVLGAGVLDAVLDFHLKPIWAGGQVLQLDSGRFLTSLSSRTVLTSPFSVCSVTAAASTVTCSVICQTENRGRPRRLVFRVPQFRSRTILRKQVNVWDVTGVPVVNPSFPCNAA